MDPYKPHQHSPGNTAGFQPPVNAVFKGFVAD
jgi:hypothetical protein